MSAAWSGGSTRAWRRLRLFVLDRDGWRCQVPTAVPGLLCKAPAEHVDHIVERSQGGTDDPANLRAACAACNLRRPGRGRNASARPRRATPRWSW